MYDAELCQSLQTTIRQDTNRSQETNNNNGAHFTESTVALIKSAFLWETL